VAADRRVASIRDVARRANVSISTVSRVISRKIPVDEETQARVRKAIKELKYKPNLVASGLRSKSAKSIGLLVPRISDPFFSSLIDHVDRTAISQGYNLLLFNTHSDPAFEEQVVDNLLRRHVDGIIFSMVSDESRAMELLTDVGVPVVMFDRVRPGSRHMNLVIDNRKAGEIAADHLLGLGHRSFACLTGPLTISLCADRLAGFSERLERSGHPLGTGGVLRGDFSFESGAAAAEMMLRSIHPPTAVWAQNDLMAAGLIKGLARTGVRVPEQVSVMGMDGLIVPEIVTPALTTITQPVEEMARRAVEMILEAKNTAVPPGEVVLQPRLMVRDSTTRCPNP